ncbi:hypothetical protein KDA11_01100 [Candidatus Saccharibacteria bacterium]|nr:hypothetical protein [Candidatus Saccharibacteria bacterium]
MPSGVYKRTEKHIAICRKGGTASAISKVNKDRYAKANVQVICKNCSNVFKYPKSQQRLFCNKKCFDQWQIKPIASYGAIHRQVYRLWGNSNTCEHCKTTVSKKFEWANISGEYKLVREDWARLCVTCHRRYDLGVKNKIGVLNVK